MSREQWGHGYHQGRKEAFLPEVLRSWLLSYDEAGELRYAGRVVQNFPENRALLEVWDYTTLLVFLNHGYRPSEEIAEEDLREVDLPPDRSHYFASWDGFRVAVGQELARGL